MRKEPESEIESNTCMQFSLKWSRIKPYVAEMRTICARILKCRPGVRWNGWEREWLTRNAEMVWANGRSRAAIGFRLRSDQMILRQKKKKVKLNGNKRGLEKILSSVDVLVFVCECCSIPHRDKDCANPPFNFGDIVVEQEYSPLQSYFMRGVGNEGGAYFSLLPCLSVFGIINSLLLWHFNLNTNKN